MTYRVFCLGCLLLVLFGASLTGASPEALAGDFKLPAFSATVGPTAPSALATIGLGRSAPADELELEEEEVAPEEDLSEEAEAEGEDAQAEGYPLMIEEEPLVSEELPAADPDQVLRSGSAEADRLRRQAQAIEAEIKKDICFDIPIVLNERVAFFLDYFQTVARERFGTWLARSTMYLPRIQEIFRQRGMPEDMAYLALIESGFNPRAVSRSGAVGTWQFISATGARYGLKQNRWVDERRDVEKATHAAASYLTDLYREFGSWYLAAAAYNCGEGRIRRAIRSHNTDDYWEICDYQAIALETRNYVPQMIAAILIAKEPAKYGFGDICYEVPPEWEVAELERPCDLRLVAELSGTDLQRLKDLNPELRLNWTPPTNGAPYRLRVPLGSKQQLMARLAEHQEQLAASLIEHKVRRGETLSKIARRYGISRTALAAANDLSPRAQLKRGQKLVIPVGMADFELVAADEADSRPEKFGSPSTHVVRRGDTLHRIAKRYGLSLAQLKGLNPELKRREHIHPGQAIVVAKGGGEAAASKRVLKKKTHTVEKGETLYQIADRYGTTLERLRELNPDLSEVIQPGQKVVVRAKRVVAEGEAPAKRVRSYRVKPGDTLWDIARRYNVGVDDLRAWNNLGKGEPIRPGDRLKVKTAGRLGG